MTGADIRPGQTVEVVRGRDGRYSYRGRVLAVYGEWVKVETSYRTHPIRTVARRIIRPVEGHRP